MSDQMSEMPWHVVHGDTIRELLHRAHNGEDPEMLYVEFYTTAEVHEFPAEEDDDE